MLSQVNKVCHITTLHPRFDVRIYHKECISLSKLYNVILLVADGNGDQESEGISILDAGKRHSSRFLRFFITSYRLYERARKLGCDIYHFHDSDFILFAWLLSLGGKKVIYDSHEDLPRQIIGKEYISSFFRPFISRIAEFTEDLFAGKFSAVVTATPSIEKRFKRLNTKVVTVCNFPSRSEFEETVNTVKLNHICYIGGISAVRGINELLVALDLMQGDILLDIAGAPENPAILQKIKNHPKVNFMGVVDRNRIKEILGSSRIGIVTLHATPNHIESYPVKMFEYMAAGIPVVASDFPVWREIIIKNDCGLCVDPLNPQELAEAVTRLYENIPEAMRMGNNGREAIIDKYNWETESGKLITLYSEII